MKNLTLVIIAILFSFNSFAEDTVANVGESAILCANDYESINWEVNRNYSSRKHIYIHFKYGNLESIKFIRPFSMSSPSEIGEKVCVTITKL
jgi:hypothetical protein